MPTANQRAEKLAQKWDKRDEFLHADLVSDIADIIRTAEQEAYERAAKACEAEYADAPGYLVIAKGCTRAIRHLKEATDG